jgi:hypothetical protein
MSVEPHSDDRHVSSTCMHIDDSVVADIFSVQAVFGASPCQLLAPSSNGRFLACYLEDGAVLVLTLNFEEIVFRTQTPENLDVPVSRLAWIDDVRPCYRWHMLQRPMHLYPKGQLGMIELLWYVMGQVAVCLVYEHEVAVYGLRGGDLRFTFDSAVELVQDVSRSQYGLSW